MTGRNLSHSVRHLIARNLILLNECANRPTVLFRDTGAISPHFPRTMATANSLGGEDFNKGAKSKRCLTMETLNPCIKEMQYAVRGPLVIRASEIEKELEKGVQKPFTEVIKANIGDCHAMGQVPITFIRQVLSLVSYPVLLDDPGYPDDVKCRAKEILAGCRGGSVGSYSDSPGIEIIRRHVAEYIERRDCIPSSWEDVMLCAGASEGIKSVLKLLIAEVNGKRPGVMIPIPQYPLYSATISEFNMVQVPYYLDEENSWGLDVKELKHSITEGRKKCNPRAIVVINPGNPTVNTSKARMGKQQSCEHVAPSTRRCMPVRRKLIRNVAKDDNICSSCGGNYEDDNDGQEWICCLKCECWFHMSCERLKMYSAQFTCTEAHSD